MVRERLPSCCDCLYFRSFPVTKNVGYCHRYPPVPNNRGGLAIYPEVSFIGVGCGEHVTVGSSTDIEKS